MRIFALALALALAALPAAAQPTERLINIEYDPANDAAFVFCVASDARTTWPGAVLEDVSASTSLTSTGGAFRGMAVGDVLYIRPASSSTVTTTKIATFTDENTIVVTDTLTYTGASTYITWQEINCGTGADDGWFNVRGQSDKFVQANVSTLGSASISVRIEGRLQSMTGVAGAELLSPAAITATGAYGWPISEGVHQMRVGLKVATDAADVVEVRYGGSNAR